MLYMVLDPEEDPNDYEDGGSIPVTALSIIVIATVAMIDSVLTACGIGVDTKWRTQEDRGCIQAVERRRRHHPYRMWVLELVTLRAG